MNPSDVSKAMDKATVELAELLCTLRRRLESDGINQLQEHITNDMTIALAAYIANEHVPHGLKPTVEDIPIIMTAAVRQSLIWGWFMCKEYGEHSGK